MSESVLGRLEFFWPGESPVICEFDYLAISMKYELLLASVLTTPSGRKKLASMATAGSSITKLRVNGLGVDVIAKDQGLRRRPGQMTASVDGYEFLHCRLAFGLEHAMLITRNPSFLRVNSEESLWRELTSKRYTTPLLEEWMPYLRKAMVDEGYLEDTMCHKCECGMLKLSNADLDAIVVHGLKQGKIKI